jgi:hypothetical protein
MLGLSDNERVDSRLRFRIAQNPDPESRLPYLIWLPIEGGMVADPEDPAVCQSRSQDPARASRWITERRCRHP